MSFRRRSDVAPHAVDTAPPHYRGHQHKDQRHCHTPNAAEGGNRTNDPDAIVATKIRDCGDDARGGSNPPPSVEDEMGYARDMSQVGRRPPSTRQELGEIRVVADADDSMTEPYRRTRTPPRGDSMVTQRKTA